MCGKNTNSSILSHLDKSKRINLCKSCMQWIFKPINQSRTIILFVVKMTENDKAINTKRRETIEVI